MRAWRAGEIATSGNEVPNFYWAQENYLKEKQRGRPWGWTVIRPALVVGMAVGGAMNLVAALGVYGALPAEAAGRAAALSRAARAGCWRRPTPS